MVWELRCELENLALIRSLLMVKAHCFSSYFRGIWSFPSCNLEIFETKLSGAEILYDQSQ